jgi:flagellar protein FlgJ
VSASPPISNPTPAVTDFGQYTALRAAAGRNDPHAVRQAAQQFEALFTEMMLKTAHETHLGDDLTGQQGDFYKDLFDQQMAMHMSAGKGLGLADMLVRQLQQSGAVAMPAQAAVASTAPSQAAAPVAVQNVAPVAGPVAAPVATSAAPFANIDDPQWRPKSAQEFIAAIQPHAEKAAAELGVPSRALIAQAALETGWGQRIGGRQADGSGGFNLFGIKANATWSGARASQPTSEYGSGGWTHGKSDFRSYRSIGESFDDYVRFLKNNPRYADALKAGDVHGFAQGLQNAGYATDPHYAQKIVRVAYSPEISGAIGSQTVNA